MILGGGGDWWVRFEAGLGTQRGIARSAKRTAARKGRGRRHWAWLWGQTSRDDDGYGYAHEGVTNCFNQQPLCMHDFFFVLR